VLRGAAMVLMALDHTRDYFSGATVRPTDLARASAALFLTRWVTHFCAPVFVLLAGTAAYLARGRGRDGAALSRFLLSRGLWLVLLEVTVVRLGWEFDLSYRFTMLQVIWAIGWSMVLLAALVRAPASVVGAFGLVLIAGHNLLDGVDAASLGALRPLWLVLHQPGRLEPWPGHRVFVAYPLVPWAGVMAAGYGLGALLAGQPLATRRRRLVALGVAACALFALLRGGNLYGDPHPWTPSPRGALYTALAVLNCEKYPPSLAYLLVTLGPSLLALAALDGRTRGPVGRALAVYGRVPLFYYVLHLYLIHGLALAVTVARFGVHASAQQFEHGPGLGLPGVYAAWALVVATLYPACAWFARVKQRNRSAWLSYL
jgi:uncharacterized membrane protein